MDDLAVRSILIVRLGAMGDILHALPALSTLRKSFPEAQIAWVTAPNWAPLLDGNPDIDSVIPFRRNGPKNLFDSWQKLREIQPDIAIDFQGLVQSAMVGRASRPKLFLGWNRENAREALASRFYTKTAATAARHVVDQNLDLAAATGAARLSQECHLPAGRAEGALPSGPFVLASPFAGWASKQWPMEYYSVLAQRLEREGLPLVVNVPPDRARELEGIPNVLVHSSSLAGLIDATRRAAGVVGVDSGPLHLAAALRKPGVAIFGPTDPERNGPYGGTIRALRAPNVSTTYKRDDVVSESMRAISPREVAENLMAILKTAEQRA